MLPICENKDEILNLLKDRQVITLVGETGSGKSTQLPQILAEAGYCNGGKLVVCTQPRKVAAQTLCYRVQQEVREKQTEIEIFSDDNDQTDKKTRRLGIGSWVRGDKCSLRNIDILYMTEGTLVAKFMHDNDGSSSSHHGPEDEKDKFPWLKRVSAIIIDEAHERKVDTDLILGSVKRYLKIRPDLRVIICSATLNASSFVDYFDQDVPLVKVEARAHPIRIEYHFRDAKEEQRIHASSSEHQGSDDLMVDLCVEKALRVIREPRHEEEKGEGHILAFLTGQNECDSARNMLMHHMNEDELEKFEPCVLYGALPLEDQIKVTGTNEKEKDKEKEKGKRRKIIFATNVAETSITIDDVRVIIDSGLEKMIRYDTERSMDSLVTVLCSRSSCDQRAGRAGRTAPGVCHRLYSPESYSSPAVRDVNRTPEILLQHLGTMVLKLKAMGITNVHEFPFLDAPDEKMVEHAETFLMKLGAIERMESVLRSLKVELARKNPDPDPESSAAAEEEEQEVWTVEGEESKGELHRSQITDLGRKIAFLGVEPTVGKMLVLSLQRSCARDVLDLAAMLSIRSPFYVDKENPFESRQNMYHFSVPGTGDHSMLINVYRQFFDNAIRKRDRKWCKTHGLMYRLLYQACQLWNEYRAKLERFCERSGTALFLRPCAPLEESWPTLYAVLRDSTRGIVEPVDRAEHGLHYTVNEVHCTIHPSSLCSRNQRVDVGQVIYHKMQRTKQPWLLVVSPVPFHLRASKSEEAKKRRRRTSKKDASSAALKKQKYNARFF